MDRKNSASQQEALELRAFVLALAAVVDAASTPNSTLAKSLRETLDEWEVTRKSIVPKALRSAAADLLDATRDLKPDRVRAIDALFSSKSVMTLTSMRDRIWGLIPRILARGRIRNDEEYYLIVERLNDVSDSGFLGAERQKANELVAAYEAKR